MSRHVASRQGCVLPLSSVSFVTKQEVKIEEQLVDAINEQMKLQVPFLDVKDGGEDDDIVDDDDENIDDSKNKNELVQVVALCQAPFLLDDPNVGMMFPADAISRAKHYLSLTSGGLGAYSDSRRIPGVRKENNGNMMDNEDDMPIVAYPGQIVLKVRSQSFLYMLRVIPVELFGYFISSNVLSSVVLVENSLIELSFGIQVYSSRKLQKHTQKI
ncbi:unnamed protein product [Eruca vesicaria subsp. sativa]|uniref:Uncharacterized protein n=1 Tax=Eruca vesicaria subsp. sativa TaxID=29727 RepID=A0ABC8K7E6_ERUVS|nr:unnamed protein product [Eruca vesicaria subsp. sativa]